MAATARQRRPRPAPVRRIRFDTERGVFEIRANTQPSRDGFKPEHVAVWKRYEALFEHGIPDPVVWLRETWAQAARRRRQRRQLPALGWVK